MIMMRLSVMRIKLISNFAEKNSPARSYDHHARGDDMQSVDTLTSKRAHPVASP
jgi:hypothetical protein